MAASEPCSPSRADEGSLRIAACRAQSLYCANQSRPVPYPLGLGAIGFAERRNKAIAPYDLTQRETTPGAGLPTTIQSPISGSPEIGAQFGSFNFANAPIWGVVSTILFDERRDSTRYEPPTSTGAAPSHGVPSSASAMLSTMKPPSGTPSRPGARDDAMACSG